MYAKRWASWAAVAVLAATGAVAGAQFLVNPGHSRRWGVVIVS
jgi:hypothetical protein